MSNYSQQLYIKAFAKLGEYLSNPDEQLQNLVQSESNLNAWFTKENTQSAIDAIAATLTEDVLQNWLAQYPTAGQAPAKNIGLILAGNIPLVGFHDVLSVLLAGHKAVIKTSSQDNRLIRYLLQKLTEFEPAIASRFEFVERLQGFNAVIATGSDNTSRYFEYYFGKVPHIIRKNRNSIAVLSGNETTAELSALGHDIFDYFGLGCRNVSKLFVPEGYNFTPFFEAIEQYQYVSNHHKYHNNYDYNKSVLLVNGDKHLDNGFLLLKADDGLASPLAVLFFEEYSDEPAIEGTINELSDKIQCVVSALPLNISNQLVGFGKSQQPALSDYADGIDTMKFLAAL